MATTTKAMKPKLKRGQFMRKVGGIPVEMVHDSDRFSNGWLIMAIANVDVIENGERIGNIRCSVTGDSLHVTIGSRSWSMSTPDIWKAVKKADDLYMKAVNHGND